MGRREYFEKKRKYEEMIERKKKEEGQRTLARIIEDKTGKTFWEEVNRGRKRREGIDGSITEREWTEHFKEQLGVGDGRIVVEVDGEGAQGREEEIEEWEVRKAIRKLKKRKAARPDGIPNEAWKNGGELLVGVLTKVLNKIWKGEGSRRGGEWG